MAWASATYRSGELIEVVTHCNHSDRRAFAEGFKHLADNIHESAAVYDIPESLPDMTADERDQLPQEYQQL